MSEWGPDEIRRAVRERYARIATETPATRKDSGACCSTKKSCCGAAPSNTSPSAKLGYTEEELAAAPDGADMGLGCGNPQAIAELNPGETVLDLGSGGGFDCFLAARQVGDSGRVIGVDMTPEMVAKARENARRGGYTNVEFRLGEIEHLPVADASVDVILSNCVINLSPDKRAVYSEAFRVLKPGGRLAISDVVCVRPLPETVKNDPDALCGCVAGAASVEELQEILTQVGFADIRIHVNTASPEFIRDWAPGSGIEDYVAAATIQAVRPPHGGR